VSLLERETFLSSLAEYAEDARRGAGRLVLVSGEAGVGKTALLERFEQDLPDAVWAWGMCDGMFTPRPLGPLFDVAARLGGELLALCHGAAPRDALFRALLGQIDVPGRLTVVVVEDVHWADEATLDLIRFLGRRLRGVPALLVATYRDDRLGDDDPLRLVLGELAAQRPTRRMALPPLSAAAVQEMARGAPVEADELFRLTGGNPFFVTEVLRADGAGLPASARDAVLARAAVLAPEARRTLDAAALIGSRIEPWLLDAIDASGIDECLASGVLTHDGFGLRFRHEIARLTVEQAVPLQRRIGLHADLMAALRAAGSDDDACMSYHAEGAADRRAVLEYAPRAARIASAMGSHREATAQYERALRFVAGEDAATVAALHDALAYEASLIDRWEDAAAARQQALTLWRQVGDRVREGDSLRQLSRAMWRLCRGAEATVAAEAALDVLAPLPASPELAWAYANLAVQRMLNSDNDAAIGLAQNAQALAERLGQFDVLSDALNTEACANAETGREWTSRLRRALDVALAHGLEEQAGRAYANLYDIGCRLHRYADVETYYIDGVAYCDERDITTFATCLRGHRSEALVRTGQWDEAVELCRHMMQRSFASPVNRLSALMSLGTIRARRGEGDAWPLLDDAAVAADGTGEPQWITSVRLARTEAFWLDGDMTAAQHEVELAAAVAVHCNAWVRGAIVVWMRRLGMPPDGPGDIAEPHARLLAGDWRASATLWTELGCTYEAAMALADSADEAALREAVAALDSLGAAAAARVVRQTMRRRGMTAVPAGPRATTRSHQLKLTRRQQEVLTLLCAGMANAEISQRLFISERTVDHHVSAVLSKMGVPSRGVAATEAFRLGLVPTGSAGAAAQS
jgi:DNA-binding CsgD family transcriptional regulator/tetratricopeptide (TPR) repeat protein